MPWYPALTLNLVVFYYLISNVVRAYPLTPSYFLQVTSLWSN